mgnify:CR=1 FL=1
MSDRFRTFALAPANTGANTLFTVPVANVAATPPTPVTTFMVKTIVWEKLVSYCLSEVIEKSILIVSGFISIYLFFVNLF